ncbi:hypothetical protein BCR34DRAFT_573697 [Clohesyomyces aquaticus]|uniref:Uncharacterized protein n=1 Tax=Clohesyomyces aquaticus TaxID=1231657 RepID=A0A1Y1YZ49_9PLEO|nr:hypothetical protein BCR34DRAFT_573697 [Clohesyomyces aquaticus]
MTYLSSTSKSRFDTMIAKFLAQMSQANSYEPTFFDTALVAAIYKRDSFDVGIILNSMAGLNAVLSIATYGQETPKVRIEKAKAFLHESLKKWDPRGDAHLPRSLELVLRLYNILKGAGVEVDFPRREELEEMIENQSLTTEPRGHSLVKISTENEGYRVKTHSHSSHDCGIHCSPSETALALLGTKGDSSDLETYLSTTYQATNGRGIPSVYPTSLVEVSTVLETLSNSTTEHITRSNGSTQSLSPENEYVYRVSENCLGASAHLLLAKRFGDKNEAGELERVLLDELNKEGNDLLGKMDESCRILKTLMQSPLYKQSRDAITSLFSGICRSWWMGTHINTMSPSYLYAYMLFTSCFCQILDSEELGNSSFNPEDVQIRGPVAITQMAVRILTNQNSNGSWGEGMGGCLEETSLALLSLAKMISIPFLGLLYLDIKYAIERGLEVLSFAIAAKQPLQASKANWIFASTSAYRSNRLCEAFVLAAINDCKKTTSNIFERPDITDRRSQVALKLATFFHGLPNLREEPAFKLKGAAIESSFYVQKLKGMRLDIFPPTDSKEKDKYFNYIPVMWCIHNAMRKVWAPPVFIWDISVVSLFIFLVDEYMEGTVEKFSLKELAELRQGIESMFAIEGDWAAKMQTSWTSNGGNNTQAFIPLTRISSTPDGTPCSPSVTVALDVFSRWATYQMKYPSLQSASALDLHALHLESKNYLLYHLHQATDNQRLASQSGFNTSTPFRNPSMGYAPWLHTIGGGHIAATYALTWVSACLGNKVRGPGRDCFTGVKQKCMVWNANSHNAKELRMFNDYGSIPRDAEERNLNSTNFPEFFGSSDSQWLVPNPGGYDPEFSMLQRKAALLEAAQYERKRANMELSELFQEMRAEGHNGAKLADWFGLYFAGGNQFSDMYLFKDVTNSTR